ncbi:MAG: hypothetical protein JW720_02075, partial [Sedimentisphaerales bacterium]|nr:hypothetical protein [Sedimentisphaerales bacterium]
QKISGYDCGERHPRLTAKKNLQKERCLINIGEDQEGIVWKYDLGTDGDEQMTIASISFDINRAIREFFGWQSAAMECEYRQLSSAIG